MDGAHLAQKHSGESSCNRQSQKSEKKVERRFLFTLYQPVKRDHDPAGEKKPTQSDPKKYR